jgi:hypothetical protein
MNTIQSQTLKDRISYDDLANVSKDVFTYIFKGSVGVIHEDRLFLNYEDIFWGETEENPARAKGSSKRNIKGLASSRALGIDPTCPLPAVSSCIVTDTSGKTYCYKAENGITRKKADFFNGYIEGAWFDVVRFVETEGRSSNYNREIWLQLENDGLPQESHTVDDLVVSCCTLIQSNDLPREESAIREFVYESAPNMATQDKNEVVRIVLKEEDVPTKTISWRDNECKEWLEEKCLDDVEIDYCFPFHYFQDRIYSLMKQYHESGNGVSDRKVQKVVQHFDNKGDSDDAVIAYREAQKKKWEEFRKIMKSVAQYMIVNDWQLPFDKDQYFPQVKTGDSSDDPNRIVFDI